MRAFRLHIPTAPGRLLLGAFGAAGLSLACALPAAQGPNASPGTAAQAGAASLFVLETGRPSLTLLGTLEVEQRVTVASGSSHAAVSPSGALGAISVPAQGRVQLLDIARMRRSGDIELGFHRRPSALAFIDEDRLLIGSEDSGLIALYHAAYGRVIRVLESGGSSSTEFAIDTSTATVWVLDTEAGQVARLGWTRPELRRSDHLGEALTGLAQRPNSNELWVLCSATDRIIVLSKDTLVLLGEIPCASAPVALAFDNEGDAWVVCRDSAEVLRIDARTGALRARISVPSGPEDQSPAPSNLLIDPDLRRAWITCPGTGTLQVVDMGIERCVAQVDELAVPTRLLRASKAE